MYGTVLYIAQILRWTDAHHERTGHWPDVTSGAVHDTLNEKWPNLDRALREGCRGLPRGSSLARLLAEHRGVRNRKGLPALSVRQILGWADAHHRRTGQWPNRHSGPAAEAPGETWQAVQAALVKGIRGLPGGSSLAQLLAEHRGVRNCGRLPRLTIKQILAWADAHHRETGHWPNDRSGSIRGAAGTTWLAVDVALRNGGRGLRGGSSLARLLARARRVRNDKNLPRLTREAILAWADAHHRRTGQWPTRSSGAIADAPGETWGALYTALRRGRRGLGGGTSLSRLLGEQRGGARRDCNALAESGPV